MGKIAYSHDIYGKMMSLRVSLYLIELPEYGTIMRVDKCCD